MCACRTLVSERCVLTAKPDGTGTGGHWLTSLRRTAVRRGGPAPRIVGYENQTDASHATIGSDLAGSAGGLCRQTHGRGRMQALLRPRGLCRGPTRTRAWHRPQLSTVKRTHNIPGIGARLNPERGMVMDATGPVGGEERTACALSPACCRSDACEMSACLLIGERNGRRRRSRIASRCCCCRCQRGQCSSR